MKKTLLFLSIFALFACFAPRNASAIVLTNNTLIKGASFDSVYYYADGKRYVFPNEKTYFTWYSDFGSVQTITDAELAAIPISANVTYRPGVKMIKIQTDPKVYAVDKGGILRWVASEQVAQDLYGTDWNKMIDDVPDYLFINYNVGEPITGSAQFSAASIRDGVKTISEDVLTTAPTTPAVPATSTIPATPTAPATTTPAVPEPATVEEYVAPSDKYFGSHPLYTCRDPLYTDSGSGSYLVGCANSGAIWRWYGVEELSVGSYRTLALSGTVGLFGTTYYGNNIGVYVLGTDPRASLSVQCPAINAWDSDCLVDTSAALASCEVMGRSSAECNVSADLSGYDKVYIVLKVIDPSNSDAARGDFNTLKIIKTK